MIFDGLFHYPGENIFLVSHAHSDHLPKRQFPIIASDVTKKILEYKKKKDFISTSSERVELLDAGHILGSKMFLIDREILYTGDFNTEKTYSGQAKPISCKTLIIETTYGKPIYKFPPKYEVLEELQEYIEDNDKVMLTTSDRAFGKPQELCMALEARKILFSTSEVVKKVNDLLGLKFSYFDPDASVVVGQRDGFIGKEVHLSGWCRDHYWRRKGFFRTKGLVFSSHCDFPSLINFVEKCNPEMVLTHHGFADEFALELRKRGFRAMPLHSKRRGEHQSRLDAFSL